MGYQREIARRVVDQEGGLPAGGQGQSTQAVRRGTLDAAPGGATGTESAPLAAVGGTSIVQLSQLGYLL